jgi:6,7-dimethyl-8-ribityllumazine synthase
MKKNIVSEIVLVNKAFLKNLKISIVVSKFNKEITSKLYCTTLARLKEYKFIESQIDTVWVPGAVEIPIVAQKLISVKKYDVVICLGTVIRGETSHFDYVCNQVSYGCQKVALENNIPIIFGVLTTENEQQAIERINKGIELADSAIEMANLLFNIK